LTRKPTVEAIVNEIGRYDGRDAARVSQRIRETASLANYLDRVEAIHREMVSTVSPSPDPVDALRAHGRFLAQWLKRLGDGMIPENFDTLMAAREFTNQHQALLASAEVLREDNAALRARLELLTREA